MIKHIPRPVDFDRMAWLLEMFKIASKSTKKLFHITRTVIAANQNDPQDCQKGWEEFRAEGVCFEFRSYDRGLTGWQHSCYQGCKGRLTEYTGLAAVAATLLPHSLCVMWDRHRNPSLDRDSWSWAMYRLALHVPESLPVDLEGDGTYAKINCHPGWLHQVVADAGSDPSRLQQDLLAWQSEVSRQAGCTPRHVYGALALDVFASSVITLKYLLDHAQELYFPSPSVIVLGPRYFTGVLEATRSAEARIHSLIQVDRMNSRVTFGKVSYKVDPDSADLIAMLCDAGGHWLTGPQMREILSDPNYRPDRAKKKLKSPLSDIVESRENTGYRIDVAKLPEHDS